MTGAPLPLIVPNRECGPCRLCCKVMVISELEKPAGDWCKFACSKGCSNYEERPTSCREFACLWLKGVLREQDRPDKTRLVLIEVEGDTPGMPAVLQNPATGTTHVVIVARESYPGAADGPGRDVLEHCMVDAGLAILVAGPEGERKVLFPRVGPTNAANGPTRIQP